jgi:hypothetical protein
MLDAPDDEEASIMREPDPAAMKKLREREGRSLQSLLDIQLTCTVLFLRHKIQKGFLSRDQAPVEGDMPQMSQYIKKLEDYEDQIEVSTIRTTKINKVLKALVKLNTIPKDEEFQFRKRSVDLLAKWNKIMGAEPQEGDSKGEDGKETSKSTPATNGVHEEGSDAKDATTSKEEPAAAAPAPTSDESEKPTSTATEAAKPTEPESEPAAPAEQATEASITEEVKAAVPAEVTESAPATTDKAPESAEAAVEATETVKAAE